jgi:hypothetical protein
MQVWAEPFTRLRLPKLFNLRTDPFEFADVTSNSYYEWFLYHDYILFGAFIIADQWAATFKEFPPVRPGKIVIVAQDVEATSSVTRRSSAAGSRRRNRRWQVVNSTCRFCRGTRARNPRYWFRQRVL